MDSYYITIRVMEVMLNLVDTLMETGVHKNWNATNVQDNLPGSIDPLLDFNRDKDKDTKVKKPRTQVIESYIQPALQRSTRVH